MSIVQVRIHQSQFPDCVREDLLQSLRTRQILHKFHYDSIKQTQKWLALHEAYSPARTDADCVATYDLSFRETVSALDSPVGQLIGLGCGGGQKETRLLQFLAGQGRRVRYTPCDVSTAMVLVAHQAALTTLPDAESSPLVCDLSTVPDWRAIFDCEENETAPRLMTFFGMMPNFEPAHALPQLAQLLRPRDSLLLSANLAPGPDYAAGVQQVFPLYDNAMTREWLLTVLLDLGVERSDGEVRFAIEDSGGLKRIVAWFEFTAARVVAVGAEKFSFKPGERIRLFFSYRHTPELLSRQLRAHGIAVARHWISRSGEEGVFLCRRL